MCVASPVTAPIFSATVTAQLAVLPWSTVVSVMLAVPARTVTAQKELAAVFSAAVQAPVNLRLTGHFQFLYRWSRQNRAYVQKTPAGDSSLIFRILQALTATKIF